MSAATPSAKAANSGAALRQMESEVARIERRLQDWQMRGKSQQVISACAARTEPHRAASATKRRSLTAERAKAWIAQVA